MELPEVLFTHLYRCEPGWSMGRRAHPDCQEMFFVLEGRGSFTLEGTRYDAEAGDVFLIGPGQVHCAEADPSDPYVYYSLHYSGGPTSLGGRYPSKVRVEDLSEVRDVIYKMEAEKARRRMGCKEMMGAYLLQLLTLVARAVHREDTSSPLDRRHRWVAERIKEYLQDHMYERITLAEVAEQVSLSPHYCCLIFRKVTGYTIFQYLNLIRVERAKALFRHSHLNVTEVAQELGYKNVYYFSRVFKKVTGVPPSRFVGDDRKIV